MIGTGGEIAPVLDEDQRFELVMESSRRERRSRPRWLVWLGIASVAAGLVFALLSFSAQRRAEAGLERERARLAELQSLIETKRQYDMFLGASGRGEPTDPQRVLESFVRIWEEVGAPGTLPTINPKSQRLMGGIHHEWRWEKNDMIRNESLEAVLTWMKRSIEEIRDLELIHLHLSPNIRNTLWQVEVVFRIWEPSR